MPVMIDLSSNNGHPIDYQAAKDFGVTAVVVKATEGTGYVNPYYNADTQGFAAVGVPVIAYHFASFTNPTAEARFFQSVAGWRARVLDSETNTDARWQQLFLDALGLAGDQEMDYGSASYLPRGGVRSLLWPAAYGRNPGWGDAWQYTDALQVTGIPGLTDGSVWTGSPADFNALFNLDPPAPTPQPTNYPGDNVKAIPINVPIGAGNGWVPSPVPAASVINVTIDDTNPEAVGAYNDSLPTFRGVATQTSTHAPNGALVFTGPADGTFGAVVWTAE
jgi:hypothetical protein